ncbi:MAG: cyclic nucleotide-binding domain-containing protein [Alphaproteobacteria bacterium]|nr:cyclic nucleotide-binding domain-containing protein [Alphaproteobacteria bacterium]
MALSKSLSILDRHTFLPGDVIFREGEMGDCAFIINQGLVEITKKSGRRSVVLDRVGVQGIFGEMAMIDAKPRSATATALEPTQCLVQRFLETTHIRWHDRGASFDKLRMRVAHRGTKIVPQSELVEGRTALIPATARKLGIAVLVIKNKVLRQKIDKAAPFLRALLRIMVRNLRSTNWLAAGPGG